ncbi:protein kinase [Planctomycetota bacterium]
MELVRGLPITEYCDSNHLNTQERLALFISVCQAVQHAHQKGIIHRDIKPTNIMVTLHDGEPVVKVIDFGIAKAVNQQLTEKTIFTRYSQMIGTPEYMSPEQAEMSGLDIDTRTDVFSLGVLLYELLTGSTPFDSDYLLSKSYGEMQRIIREEEPTRPSTKVSTLGDTLTDVAKQRRTSPEMLCKLIRTDLDWIVMKTLEKDRSRRYESVSELASDITRHLNHEPVLAGRPSVLYRIHKFVKRNKGLVASAIAIVCILLLATGVSLWQMLRANRAAQQEKTVSTQLGIEKDRAVKAEATVRQQRDHAKAQALTTRQRAYAAEMNSAYQALENNSLNRALELLDRHQPESGQEDLRGFEWRYLWQQCRFDDIGSFKDQHRRGAAFSRDGRYLALASGAKAVIRDPVSWVKIVELPGHASFVGFSPSADTLVTAGDKINVWDTKTFVTASMDSSLVISWLQRTQDIIRPVFGRFHRAGPMRY